MELKKLKQTDNYSFPISETLSLALNIVTDFATGGTAISGHIFKDDTPVGFVYSSEKYDHQISISATEKLTQDERGLMFTKTFEILEDILKG